MCRGDRIPLSCSGIVAAGEQTNLYIDILGRMDVRSKWAIRGTMHANNGGNREQPHIIGSTHKRSRSRSQHAGSTDFASRLEHATVDGAFAHAGDRARHGTRDARTPRNGADAIHHDDSNAGHKHVAGTGVFSGTASSHHPSSFAGVGTNKENSITHTHHSGQEQTMHDTIQNRLKVMGSRTRALYLQLKTSATPQGVSEEDKPHSDSVHRLSAGEFERELWLLLLEIRPFLYLDACEDSIAAAHLPADLMRRYRTGEPHRDLNHARLAVRLYMTTLRLSGNLPAVTLHGLVTLLTVLPVFADPARDAQRHTESFLDCLQFCVRSLYTHAPHALASVVRLLLGTESAAQDSAVAALLLSCTPTSLSFGCLFAAVSGVLAQEDSAECGDVEGKQEATARAGAVRAMCDLCLSHSISGGLRLSAASSSTVRDARSDTQREDRVPVMDRPHAAADALRNRRAYGGSEGGTHTHAYKMGDETKAHDCVGDTDELNRVSRTTTMSSPHHTMHCILDSVLSHTHAVAAGVATSLRTSCYYRQHHQPHTTSQPNDTHESCSCDDEAPHMMTTDSLPHALDTLFDGRLAVHGMHQLTCTLFGLLHLLQDIYAVYHEEHVHDSQSRVHTPPRCGASETQTSAHHVSCTGEGRQEPQPTRSGAAVRALSHAHTTLVVRFLCVVLLTCMPPPPPRVGGLCHGRSGGPLSLAHPSTRRRAGAMPEEAVEKEYDDIERRVQAQAGAFLLLLQQNGALTIASHGSMVLCVLLMRWLRGGFALRRASAASHAHARGCDVDWEGELLRWRCGAVSARGVKAPCIEEDRCNVGEVSASARAHGHLSDDRLVAFSLSSSSSSAVAAAAGAIALARDVILRVDVLEMAVRVMLRCMTRLLRRPVEVDSRTRDANHGRQNRQEDRGHDRATWWVSRDEDAEGGATSETRVAWARRLHALLGLLEQSMKVLRQSAQTDPTLHESIKLTWLTVAQRVRLRDALGHVLTLALPAAAEVDTRQEEMESESHCLCTSTVCMTASPVHRLLHLFPRIGCAWVCGTGQRVCLKRCHRDGARWHKHGRCCVCCVIHKRMRRTKRASE